MIIRVAHINDIYQIQSVRNSVKENTLSNPGLITNKVVKDFILTRGKGWVCVIRGQVVGFSIADLKDKNVWALFVKPGYEGLGIGQKLHDIMLNWYFSHTRDNIWLGTLPKTRAEKFYRKSGWKEIGTHADGEIKFEMTYEFWRKKDIPLD